MNKDYDKLLQYALRILVKKRYTKGEIDTKLRAYSEKKELDEGTIEEVIERLVDLKYINDAQFVRDYISDRAKFKPRGLRLIKQELYTKGIRGKVLDKYLEDICSDGAVDEVGMAVRLLEKKKGSFNKLEGARKRQKVFTFLYSKGFLADTIYKAIGTCYDELD